MVYLNSNYTNFLALGSASGSGTVIMKNAWDKITVYDKTVTGNFGNNGQWWFIVYKYTGSKYGMMMAMTYYMTPIYILSVQNGMATVKQLSTANT